MSIHIPVRKVEVGNLSGVHPPCELWSDPEHHTSGVPWLHGALDSPAPQSFKLALHIHTGAGIPIIEGQCLLQAGMRRFSITELRPLGIEAYAHRSDVDRTQVGGRIWTRAVYATLTFIPTE